MKCPHCRRSILDEEALMMIPEAAILRKSASILGARGRGKAKSRDPDKMRQAGRLGGRPRKKERRQKI